MKLKIFLLCLFFFGYFNSIFPQKFDNSLAIGELPDKSTILKIPVSIELGELRRKEIFRIKLPIVIIKNWYIYSLFQNPENSSPSKVELVTKKLQPLEIAYETNSFIEKSSLGIELKIHQNKPIFYQNFLVPANHLLGEHHAELLFFYQLCSKRICFPPEKKTIAINYTITDGESRAGFLVANRQVDLNNKIEAGFSQLQQKGFWGFLFFTILSGWLAWLTPCAFALIPLIALFFNREQQKKLPLKKRLLEPLIFIFGIALSFTTIGLVISILFGTSQLIGFAANGWSYLFITVMFCFFALIFFNFIHPLKISPIFNQLQSKLLVTAGEQQKYWILKVVLAGAIFTITTLTCTFPIIGALLIAATQGNWFYPIIGMLFFSLSFISPLLIFSIFPAKITSLKANSFLYNLQFSLGFLCLIAAVKYFSNAEIAFGWKLLNRDAAIIIWIVCFLVWFLVISFSIIKKKKKIIMLGVPLIFTFGSVFYLSSGLKNNSLGGIIDALLPPSSNGYLSSNNSVTLTEFQSLTWHSSFEKAQQIAKQTNKPIFLDFSGKVCTNCRWMEQNIFVNKDIFKKLKQDFILVKLYTDLGTEAKQNLEFQQQNFGNIALPFYAVIKNNSVLKQRAGIIFLKQFNKFLTI